MQILIFIPALLVFLYTLYRLVKDDYVFIRKGISLEQSFDVAFITLWVSLFMSRLFYMLFHMHAGDNIVFYYFSLNRGGFSLKNNQIKYYPQHAYEKAYRKVST